MARHSYDYDLIVLGAGSGGVRAARIAGGHGARVAIVEDRYYGGTCVNVGCVPKKLLAYGAQVGHDRPDWAGYGWTLDGLHFDWATLIRNKDAEIARLQAAYRRNLGRAGVEAIDGHGTLADAHTVDVDGTRYSAERLIVATGGWPQKPGRIPGLEHAITSNEAFHLDALPERLVIVGGGYIAVEFAAIFNNLGSEVVHVHRGDAFLRGFDGDIRQELTGQLGDSGIDLRLERELTEIARRGDGRLDVTLTDGGQVVADQVLCATGRGPNTAGLGLEDVGVELDKAGRIQVDGHYRSSLPHIHALGDCTDTVQLTPVAINEGHVLADNLYGPGRRAVNYATVPSAVFSQPPIATCGLTEAAARARYGALDLYRTRFTPMKYALSGRGDKMLMKVIVERARQRVVGIHLLGPDAPEMIQGFAVAMTAGATKADFDRTVGLHPTSAEELVTLRQPEAEAAADTPWGA